jgi:hypothetical protein
LTRQQTRPIALDKTDWHLLRVEQCATLRTQIRPFEVARPERRNILSAWVGRRQLEDQLKLR